jgi:tetratricopeptide (TPR) repeat protein
MNMTRFLRRRWILSAAVAGVLATPLLTPSVSSAQYRINSGGRALDANNKVGSGGQNPNDAAVRQPNLPTGNDIVTGNVTAGRHFRGDINYTDPGAFRGRTAGVSMDNFLRQSSGAGKDARLAETQTRFYGDARGVAPPPNTVQTNIGASSYVPAGPAVNRSVGDQRMGAVDFNAPYVLPAAGQLLLPGPIDPSAGQQYITASPLTGIRQLGINDLNSVVNTQYTPQTGRLDQNQILKMQEELNNAADQSNPGAAPTVDPLSQQLNAAGSTDSTTGAPAAKPGALPTGPGAVPIEQKPIQGDTGATAIEQKSVGQPITNALNTNQSTRQRLLAPPQAQSTLYAELLRKHQETVDDQNVTDAQAAQAFNAARRAQEQANAATATPGAPGQPGAAPGQPGATPGQPGVTPGQPGQPGAVGTTTPPGGPVATGGGVTDYAKRNEQILKQGLPDQKPGAKKKAYVPVKVPSLASGVKAKGLGDLLKNAETLMKDGQFQKALDQYDQAEQVAPNNPLTRLGRANAELGASFYARSEAHLREVFQKNPELLSGQYDLTTMLGEQRLQGLIKDLKTLANQQQQEPRPVFLLAYISYNTGHEQQAEAYLDLADKRSGGRDAFFQLLRDNWALPQAANPTTAPAAEQNK